MKKFLLLFSILFLLLACGKDKSTEPQPITYNINLENVDCEAIRLRWDNEWHEKSGAGTLYVGAYREGIYEWEVQVYVYISYRGWYWMTVGSGNMSLNNHAFCHVTYLDEIVWD